MNEQEQEQPRPAFVDLPRARELLQAAMETQGPDFQYVLKVGMPCHYTPQIPSELFPEGDPRCVTGCLIGVAVDLAGHTFHHRRDIGFRCNSQEFREEPGYDWISQAAADYWRQAQLCQDRAGTWGEAVAFAERWLADQQQQGTVVRL